MFIHMQERTFYMHKNGDHVADFTRDIRVLLLSGMAVVVGTISAPVAYALVWLISFFTNLAPAMERRL